MTSPASLHARHTCGEDAMHLLRPSSSTASLLPGSSPHSSGSSTYTGQLLSIAPRTELLAAPGRTFLPSSPTVTSCSFSGSHFGPPRRLASCRRGATFSCGSSSSKLGCGSYITPCYAPSLSRELRCSTRPSIWFSCHWLLPRRLD